MRKISRRQMIKLATVAAAGCGAGWPLGAFADPYDRPDDRSYDRPRDRSYDRPGEFAPDDVIRSGHKFFGTLSRDLASVVEEATRRWGRPNGYILGQEASGAFIGGLRYGEGVMYTRNAGERKVFWQGPSLGFDAGADGDRTMMLVYGLPAAEAIYGRFGGVDGSAYLVGGFGMTALTTDGVVVVPIRTGIGARLGFNVSYLKFTRQSTWNPF